MTGRIFISYAHVDTDAAERVVAALISNGFSPWIDRREIRPGQSFVEQMNTGLSEASYVLVLFSAASAHSSWLGREWMSTLAARKAPVIPVLLPGGEAPQILKDIQYFDLRDSEAAGINRIVDFFRSESRPVQTTTSRAVTESPLNSATRRQLRLISIRCVDNAALNGFCFDAEIDPNSIGGSSVQERVLSLLHTVANDGLITQFANWMLIEKRRCVENRIVELKNTQEWEWG